MSIFIFIFKQRCSGRIFVPDHSGLVTIELTRQFIRSERIRSQTTFRIRSTFRILFVFTLRLFLDASKHLYKRPRSVGLSVGNNGIPLLLQMEMEMVHVKQLHVDALHVVALHVDGDGTCSVIDNLLMFIFLCFYFYFMYMCMFYFLCL